MHIAYCNIDNVSLDRMLWCCYTLRVLYQSHSVVLTPNQNFAVPISRHVTYTDVNNRLMCHPGQLVSVYVWLKHSQWDRGSYIMANYAGIHYRAHLFTFCQPTNYNNTFHVLLILFSCVWNFPWWHHHMETFSAWPVMRSFDVFFDLNLNKRLSKQSWGWWFQTPLWSLCRHCNASLHDQEPAV